MSTNTMSVEKLDIGRVIQETFATVRRNLSVLAGLALLLAVAPWVLMSIAGVAFGISFFVPGQMPHWSMIFPLFGVFGLIFAVCWATFQAAAIHVAVSDLNGKPASFQPSLAVGLRHALPVIGVVILATLAIGLGYVFFIVPGVMIAIAFILAAPAQVIERTGVFQAFTRSRALTRGNRWRIFGLIVIYAVTVWVLELVIVGLSGGFSPHTAEGLAPTLIRTLFFVPLSFLSAIFTTTGVATLYVELRRLKDGVSASDLAAVFD